MLVNFILYTAVNKFVYNATVDKPEETETSPAPLWAQELLQRMDSLHGDVNALRDDLGKMK